MFFLLKLYYYIGTITIIDVTIKLQKGNVKYFFEKSKIIL